MLISPVIVNVPSNFLKPVCATKFLCATFYQHSSIYRTTRMIYVQKTFFKGEFMCAPSFLVCAHLMTCVHVHSLEGTLVIVVLKNEHDYYLSGLLHSITPSFFSSSCFICKPCF